MTVAIAGQRLTGGFTFSKNAVTGVMSLALTNVTLELGNGGTPFVTITLNGSITVASAGVTASLTGTVLFPAFASDVFSLEVPSVTVELSTIRTATANPYVRVSAGTPLSQSSSGSWARPSAESSPSSRSQRRTTPSS